MEQKYFQKKNYFISVLSTNVIDALGVGDAFFAISSIYSLVDKNIENSAFIGNSNGALKIQYLGHEKTITTDDFFPYLKSLLL
jgi:sugar/nucleoside kinase (ribokinase family)